MNLEDILESDEALFSFSELDLERLKKDALERAESLGWEVVVIDFSDPNNFYAMSPPERIRTCHEYEQKKILFIHDNVNYYANEQDFIPACGHAEGIDFKRDHIKNKVITGQENTNDLGYDYGYYFQRFQDTIKPSAEIEYLENKLTEVENTANSLLESYGRKAKPSGVFARIAEMVRDRSPGFINLVGEPRSGKTTILRTIAKRFGVNHNDLMNLHGVLEKEIYAALAEQNQDNYILIVDEAKHLTSQLHRLLQKSPYKVVVYSSLESQPFLNDVTEIKLDYRPT